MNLIDAPKEACESDTFKTVMTILTFLLSIINLVYAIVIYKIKTKKDDDLKAKDTKVSAFNTLIIGNNLELFYKFFDTIEAELGKLREAGLSDDEKLKINEFVKDQCSALRLKFIDLFRAVSYKLYEKSLSLLDKLIDQLTNDIFDDAVDLTNHEVFQERVLNRISWCRTSVLSRIMSYDGSDDRVEKKSLSILA